ncbi:unnamed protein product, partial [Schistosoma curassoni]|uniref:SH2 domain-containing protein n=1 Tax=Schistosoma curassoni TaxID=6186 RepID=A0A183JMS2_9TREM
INSNENSIVVTEPVQITDRSFSNQSIANDYKVNLLTSSECLSCSLENQKLDDLQHNTILYNSSYINLDNGNFPIRSHSFFHLRPLDSLSSNGSHSKPDTDILYPMNGSFNQLAIRVSSSPMSVCSNNTFYQQNNCSEDQYNKTTFNGNNYGGSSIKSRRSKCEKYISPDKHTCIRSYSAMRHPNECNIRVFRSPLDVLSPCKESNIHMMNNTLTMNSEMDNKTTCQQYFNLNETTYIPDIYEFKQQPILVLTDQRQLQTITSLSNSTLQITQSSQISVEDQEHQISSRVSDLESVNLDNNFHRNYNKINNITKLSLIPILPNNSVNNTKNLWLLQQSSDNSVINSNIKRHFKRRAANHHYNQRPICYSQNIKSNIKNKFGYNSFSAPSSLISSAIATTYSELKNEKTKENEQMNYEQLQLLLPTLSTVNLTNDNVDHDDHENCLNRKFLNDFDINSNENSIVVTEPVQITDRSFSNQSITNDYKKIKN